MNQFPDLPPVWAIGCILLSALMTWLVPLFPVPLPDWLGWLIIIAGFALMIWTRNWFMRKSTPMMPRQTPSALIIEGPFRINRNPIYTGMALVILGAAIWFGSLSGFLPLLAFPLIITQRFILGEETGLRLVFGTQAEEYFSKTRRW